MARRSKDLLASIAEEAEEARLDMGGAKSGLRRTGESAEQEDLDETELEDDTEDTEEDESEQNLDSDEQDDERDEESEEDEDSEDSEEDEDDEDDEDDRHESKNEDAARRRIMQKKDREIAELREKLSSYKAAETERERKELAVEIDDAAKKIAETYKTQPAFAKEILEAAVSMAEKRISSKLPPQEILNDYEERQESRHFDSEWRPFTRTLTKEYPNARPDQIEAARKLMDDLSHDPEYGGRVYKDSKGKDRLAGYSLEYILFQNKSQFDSLLSAKKRHGLESANVASFDEIDEQPDTSTARGIDKLDNFYKNVESSTSDLRRGRRPRSRTI